MQTKAQFPSSPHSKGSSWDREPVGVVLGAGDVVAGDDAGDALLGRELPGRGQLDCRADPQLIVLAARPAARSGSRAPPVLARLARPRQPQHVVAAEPPGQDRRERFPLLLAAALVDVHDEAPRRAGLVVVVPDHEGGCEPTEIDTVRMALA